MLVNLNAPTIEPGHVTAADLDRKTNTGRIYHLHRATVAQCPPCNGLCNQGRACNAIDDTCAVEGGTFADPVPSGLVSMRRHRDIKHTVLLVIALFAVGFAWRLALPLLG